MVGGAEELVLMCLLSAGRHRARPGACKPSAAVRVWWLIQCSDYTSGGRLVLA